MTTNKENQRNRSIGLYLHLPFCQRKCSYCGFLSLVDQSEMSIQCYLNDLISEVRLRRLVTYDEEFSRQIVDTIFIGGGTPSLIDGFGMRTLLDGIRTDWTVSNEIEITMESNPNSLTVENLSIYMEAGINRLSIGVQSFDDSVLSQIGRIHDSKCAMNSVSIAKEAGFKNINLDLMFGLPGQTLQQWEETLHTAISLEPTHLSLYTLQIEEGTTLYQEYKTDKLPLVDESLDRACYHQAIELLKQYGYHRYEISNFAQEGYECRHNLKYWSMGNYIGMGLGASSHMDGLRWKNISNIEAWTAQIRRQILPVEQNSLKGDTYKDEMGIFLFTGLRKTEGVSLLEFRNRFGIDFFKAYEGCMDQITRYRENGLLDWSNPSTGKLWLTENGIDHSNEIMSEFV